MCNVPGDPWVTPGASLGPPLSLPGSPPGWFSDASKDSWKKWWILGGSRHVLGGPRRPRGSPKIEKNWFVAPKGRSKRDFLTVFVQITVCTFFAWFGIDFSQKKRQWKMLEKTCTFSQHRLLFWTRQPSRNIIFYGAKATLSFLVSLRLFLEKRRRTAPKFKPHFHTPKTPKSGSGGPVLGSKTVPN